MTKTKPKLAVLKGWKDIVQFLGQPTSTAQQLGKRRNAVEREGRMVEAKPEKLNLWLGRVSHEPVQIATETPDLSAELRRGLAYVRGNQYRTARRKPRVRK